MSIYSALSSYIFHDGLVTYTKIHSAVLKYVSLSKFMLCFLSKFYCYAKCFYLQPKLPNKMR